MTLAWEVGPFVRLKEIVPELMRLHTPPEIPSICIACIDKKVPVAGQRCALQESPRSEGILVHGAGFGSRFPPLALRALQPRRHQHLAE